MVQIISIVSQEDFNKHVAAAKRDHVLVVHFWASWATQCQHMDQVLEELAKSFDQQKISFCKVNAENDEDLCKKYHIISVPTFVFFKNGQVVDRLEGADAPCLTTKVRTLASSFSLEAPPEHAEEKEDLNERITKLINSTPCLLFMKGSAIEPRCGFSKQAIELLKKHNAEFKTYDILSDPELRQGLKEYSDWPTYPQLYIKGKFIGGLDIMRELDEAGTLSSKLPKKEPALLNDRLQALINQAPVMVFMKGSPEHPRCGFSKTLVSILNNTGVPYETFDILKDEEVRQGLKTYSDWPTYPQVYVNGSLIGGLDIVKELYENGELLEKLQKH